MVGSGSQLIDMKFKFVVAETKYHIQDWGSQVQVPINVNDIPTNTRFLNSDIDYFLSHIIILANFLAKSQIPDLTEQLIHNLSIISQIFNLHRVMVIAIAPSPCPWSSSIIVFIKLSFLFLSWNKSVIFIHFLSFLNHVTFTLQQKHKQAPLEIKLTSLNGWVFAKCP